MIVQEKNKVYTVTELSLAIKALFEMSFSSVSVQGEISNLKLQASGHMYFTLKDSESQIRCVLFKNTFLHLLTQPKEGEEVTLTGQLSVYPPQGNYQLIVRSCQKVGLGALLQKYQELKKELQELGYFDEKRKKTLPLLPKRIGVVTSPTGAVIQDIVRILKRRFKNFSLILNPVKVQGSGAKEEIASAIKALNEYDLADVIIVGRGGGSLEDLWAFNERLVADAIFYSKIPIISAVGHETDFTLSDFVADIRASTPSAAAEIVVKEKQLFIDQLQNIQSQLVKYLFEKITFFFSKLTMLKKHPLFSNPYHLTEVMTQQLDFIQESIPQSFINYISQKREQLNFIKKQFVLLSPEASLTRSKEKFSSLKIRFHQMLLNYFTNLQKSTDLMKKKESLFIYLKKFLDQRQEKTKGLALLLKSLDPKNLLLKGYTILFSEKNHSIILSSKSVEPKEKIYAKLFDGQIFAVVSEVKK